MIEPLYITASQSLPEVVLNKQSSIFSIKGDILPEDSVEFFSPIFNWFIEYSKNPNDITILEIDISIINTSSTRRLVKLFKILEELAVNNFVEVKWIYLLDDEIMQFTAYEFQNAFKNLKFTTYAK